MGCNSCGTVDQYLSKLPGKLDEKMFSSILRTAPKVYAKEIGLQTSTSKSIWLGQFETKQFPEDQTEFYSIRVTRSAGLQFYDNNEVFRKLHNPDNCVEGCLWDPHSFAAGSMEFASTMEVADFEQVVPCYDNMYKKMAFVEYFKQVPRLLNVYTEEVAASYIRNTLLARAKKLLLTSVGFRGNRKDPRKWLNIVDSGLAVGGLLPRWELTPSVMVNFLNQVMIAHPDVEGLQGTGNAKVYGVVMDHYQYTQKCLIDKTYANIFQQNDNISSEFLKRINAKQYFGDSFVLIPAGLDDLPIVTFNAAGDVQYNFPTIDAPTSMGVRRIGNPAYQNALASGQGFGIALVIPGNIGHLWAEDIIPHPSLPGGVKIGPDFGNTKVSNNSWQYISAYDFDKNPYGKGGKWINQIKTGFHPDIGVEGVYAILYPLSSYAEMKKQVVIECGSEPVVCNDNFTEECAVCPTFVECCSITSTRAKIVASQEVLIDGEAAVADDVIQLTSKGAKVVAATIDEVIEDNGQFVYLVTLASALNCACIDGFVCEASSNCYGKVIDTTACQEPAGRVGLRLSCELSLTAADVVTAVFANGTEGNVTYHSRSDVNGVQFDFFTATIANVCAAGGIVAIKVPEALRASCADVDLVSPCVVE